MISYPSFYSRVKKKTFGPLHEVGGFPFSQRSQRSTKRKETMFIAMACEMTSQQLDLIKELSCLDRSGKCLEDLEGYTVGVGVDAMEVRNE